MTAGSPGPLVLARLRQSLSAKLASEAKRRGVAADLIRKQYIFAIFLGRVFRQPDVPWVLLGGNALLIRTGGGRLTADIDLARQFAWDDLQSARAELQQLVDTSAPEDHFVFDLHTIQPHRAVDEAGYGVETAKIKARAMLGAMVFEEFSIDITTRRHPDGPVDIVPLRPVIDHESLQGLKRPRFDAAPV